MFEIKDNILTISVKTQLGASEESIEVEQNCPDIRIGFNPRYLLDALSAVYDDEAEISLSTSKTPAVIGRQDDDYRYVVLPVNI